MLCGTQHLKVLVLINSVLMVQFTELLTYNNSYIKIYVVVSMSLSLFLNLIQFSHFC